MSEAPTKPARRVSNGWRSRLVAPALGGLAVLCCLGAPLVVGAVGSLTLGVVFGTIAGAAALLALCIWATKRLI
jgi:hypothetical protein